MVKTLTEIAREGYDGNPNEYLVTSPNWYAHRIGQYLHSTGRTAPKDVRMSRGSKVRASGMLFEYVSNSGFIRIN